MKKGILLLALLCMVAVLPISVAAVNTTVEASQSLVNPGQEVTFTVNVKGAKDIRSMAVLPLYDAESFELLEGTWLMTGVLSDYDTEKDMGVIALSGATDVDTQVFRFVLQAKKTAVLEKKEIGCTVVLMNSKSQRTELTAESAQVTLAEQGAHAETPQQTTEEGADNQIALWIGVAAAAVIGGVAIALRLKHNTHKS